MKFAKRHRVTIGSRPVSTTISRKRWLTARTYWTGDTTNKTSAGGWPENYFNLHFGTARDEARRAERTADVNVMARAD
ncbi:hypothetical protein J6590_021143 [Homalodisca vitripennis]|nr:hypothetical protein J6590_021143 [Homalodisca vitripennis]